MPRTLKQYWIEGVCLSAIVCALVFFSFVYARGWLSPIPTVVVTTSTSASDIERRLAEAGNPELVVFRSGLVSLMVSNDRQARQVVLLNNVEHKMLRWELTRLIPLVERVVKKGVDQDYEKVLTRFLQQTKTVAVESQPAGITFSLY